MATPKKAANKGAPKRASKKAPRKPTVGEFAVKTASSAEDVRIRKLRSKVVRDDRAGRDCEDAKAALAAFDSAQSASARDAAGEDCVKLLGR